MRNVLQHVLWFVWMAFAVFVLAGVVVGIVEAAMTGA